MSYLGLRRSRAATFTSAAALAAVFAVPGLASADVTSTNVTSVAPESIFDLKLDSFALIGGTGDVPMVTVTGTAQGGTSDDTLYVGCSLSVNGLGVFVPLGRPVPATDGAFSADVVEPPATCRLRAVPLDEDESTVESLLKSDEELAPFAGPRVRGGAIIQQQLTAEGYPIDEGTDPDTKIVDLFLNARGQGRGFAALSSLGSGFGSVLGGGYGSGITGGLLATAPIDGTAWRLLLGPSGGLGGFGAFADGEDPSSVANAGIVVDGVPAYVFPVDGSVDEDGYPNGETAKLVSRTVDPATGDTTIVERAPIVIVSDGAGGFAPAGVRLERTTVQDKEGRRVTFSDVFRSVDGAKHDIELRYGGSAITAILDALGDLPDEVELPEGLDEILTERASFRVPWKTGEEYVVPTAGDTFGPAPAGRSTIWVHGPRLDLGKIEDLAIPPTTTTMLAKPSQPVSGPAAAPRSGASTGEARLAAGPSSAVTADPGGAVPRAEGAITFDAAPTDGRFLTAGSFVARFVREIPADGTTAIAHTYSQDVTAEGLRELVEGPKPPVEDPKPPLPAETPLPTQPAPTPQLPAVPVLPDGRPTPFNPLPKLSKSTGKVLITKAQGRRLRDRKPVTITTKGMPAGRYGVTIRRWVRDGRTIASGVKTIRQDGDLKIRLSLTKYGKKYLRLKRTRARKDVTVRVIVTWTPPGKARKRSQTSYLTKFR